MSQIPPTGTTPAGQGVAAGPLRGDGPSADAPRSERATEALAAAAQASGRTPAVPSAADTALAVRAENLRVQGPGVGEAARAAQDALTRVQAADQGLARVESLIGTLQDATAAAQAAPEADGPQRVADALTQEIAEVLTDLPVVGDALLEDLADLGTLGLEGLSLAAPEALDAVDAAAARVTEARGELGQAAQGYALVLGELLDGSPEATAARVRDLDTATEVAASAQALLLQDPIAAVTAQANVVPSQVQALLA